MTSNKRDLRITINMRKSDYSDVVTFRAGIRYYQGTPKYESDTPGFRCFSPWDRGEIHFADLEITAQRNAEDTDHNWYGMKLEYRDVHSMDLRELEGKVKGLRAVQRKMDKLAERFGHPADLATFCAHVADAIGCQSSTPFALWHEDIQYTGDHYEHGDVGQLRYWLAKA